MVVEPKLHFNSCVRKHVVHFKFVKHYTILLTSVLSFLQICCIRGAHMLKETWTLSWGLRRQLSLSVVCGGLLLFGRPDHTHTLVSAPGLLLVIWAVSGWGSRLYSLVGGTAPRSGDNYTVYCLPGQTHSTLTVHSFIIAKSDIVMMNVMLCCLLNC